MFTNRPIGPSPATSQPAPAPMSGGRSGSQGGDQFDNGIVWSFLVVLALYVGWAYLEAHERVRESVRPSNVVLNLRTIALVTFTAVIGINAGRIVLAKMAAWNIPGAAYLLTLWANA